MPQPLSALYAETFPGKHSKWTPADMPALTGKVAVVTGGYTGIGLETVHALLQHDIAKVIVAGRSQTKYDEAVKKLKARGDVDSTLNRMEFLECDLASLKAIQKAGEELKSKTSKVHMLFASAGVMMPPLGSKSADGYELQLATNALGHHYLIQLALPLLLAAREKNFSPRVALTSSSGHNFIVGPPAFSKADPEIHQRGRAWYLPTDMRKNFLYGHSKIANILTANKFNRLYASQGLVFASCNPGNLKTELARHIPALMQRGIQWLLFPAPYGALNQLYICTSDDGEKLGGQYVAPWTRIVSPSVESKDQKSEDELYEWCEEQIKKVVG